MNVLQKIICKLFQITPEVKYVDKVIEKKSLHRKTVLCYYTP